MCVCGRKSESERARERESERARERERERARERERDYVCVREKEVEKRGQNAVQQKQLLIEILLKCALHWENCSLFDGDDL